MSQHTQQEQYQQTALPQRVYPTTTSQRSRSGSRNVLRVALAAVGVAFLLTAASCDASTASTPAETVDANLAEPVETSSSPPTDDKPATTLSTQASFYQPAINTNADPDKPFWSTVFELTAPDGAWERLEIDPRLCKLVDEERYELSNDSGTRIAAFDQEPTITFGRSTSIVDGDTCIVDAIVLGDYVDDLGDSYTVSDGELSATFTPEEFFLGQSTASGMPDDGRGRQPLTP